MSCPDCFRGGRATGEPKGSVETLHGVPTYVASPETPSTSPSTVIYFTDAFGANFLNNKVLADAYASATGLRVLVPHLIPGGGMPDFVLDHMDTVGKPVGLLDVGGQVARVAAVVGLLWHFVPFVLRAKPTKPSVYASCLAYARAVKAALPEGGKLGLAGFCWGGYLSIHLCKETAVEGGGERLVDAAFAAHPSFLNGGDDIINAIVAHKSPLSLAHAENDIALKTAQVEEAEAALRQKAADADYQIEIYKGVSHGFAVRAKPGEQKEADSADKAKAQAVEWYKKWL